MPFFGRLLKSKKNKLLNQNERLNKKIIDFLEKIAIDQKSKKDLKISVADEKSLISTLNSNLEQQKEFDFFTNLFNFLKKVQIELLLLFDFDAINSLGDRAKYLLFFKREWDNFLEKQNFEKNETKESVKTKAISKNQFLIFLLLINYFLNKFRENEEDKITFEFLKKIFKKYQKDTGDKKYQNLFILEEDSIHNLFLSVLMEFITKDSGNEIRNLEIIKKLFLNININNDLTHQGETIISRIFGKLLEKNLGNKKSDYEEFLRSLLEEEGKALDLIKYQDSTELIMVKTKDKSFFIERRRENLGSLKNAFECQKKFKVQSRVSTTIFSQLIEFTIKVKEPEIKRQNLNLLLIACEHLNKKYDQTKATEKEKAYFEFMMNSVVYLGNFKVLGIEDETRYLSILECLNKISESLPDSGIREKEILGKTIGLMSPPNYKIKTIKQLKEGLKFEAGENKFFELEDFSIFEQFKNISQDKKQDTEYFMKKYLLNQIDQISKSTEEAIITEESKKVISYLDKNELEQLRRDNININSNLQIRDIGKNINNQLYQAFSNKKITQEIFLEPKTYMGLGLHAEVYEDGDNFVFEIIENPIANSLIGIYNSDAKENKKIKKGCVIKIARSENINDIYKALLYIRNYGLNKNTIIENLNKNRIEAKITPAIHSLTADKKIEFFDFGSVKKEPEPKKYELGV